jgi:hypothetical protein
MNGSTLSGLLVVAGACLASCAPGPRFGAGEERAAHAARITLEQALNAAALGPISRSELVAALGETSGVRFESGYEVLVYPVALEISSRQSGTHKDARDASADAQSRSTAELVVLVAPSGYVVKTRIRLPPARE